MTESPQANSRPKAHRYACPGCAADLVFEPKGGQLECPYCGRTESIPTRMDEVVERSFEEYLRPREGLVRPISEAALEAPCEGCGATVTFTPPDVAGECAFCGRPIVAQAKSSDPIVAPESVLPFLVSSNEAGVSVKTWLSSRWFAPNALKKLAYQESIEGVYLPYWTYDAHATTLYVGQRGDYYYESESYVTTDAQGNRVTRRRQVRRTRWSRAEGMVARWFDEVLVPATTSVSASRLDELAPWDLAQLKPYEPSYLAGWKAQRYQIGLQAGFDRAREVMARVIDRDVRDDIGGDEQRVDHLATSYSAITFKHILLPVYIGAYWFRQKVYQVTVNARTGEVQGDRPYSVLKIVLFILVVLAVVGLVAFLAGGG